jgi:hypothetical protein
MNHVRPWIFQSTKILKYLLILKYKLSLKAISSKYSMETTEIFLIVALTAFVGFRIYKKYFVKDQPQKGSFLIRDQRSSAISSSKDDDYEPYSKKQ